MVIDVQLTKGAQYRDEQNGLGHRARAARQLHNSKGPVIAVGQTSVVGRNLKTANMLCMLHTYTCLKQRRDHNNRGWGERKKYSLRGRGGYPVRARACFRIHPIFMGEYYGKVVIFPSKC